MDIYRHRLLISRLAGIAAAAAVACSSTASAEALFQMNFEPVPGGSLMFGSGTADTVGDFGHLNQTPLLDEQVTDPNTGITYYHMVLGSMASGFAQEIYIQASFDYGGFQGGPSSASLGTGAPGGNGSDPLDLTSGIVTGEGSGNPNRVIMRQVMTGTDMSSEFLKTNFATKPKITQDISATDMSAHVAIDMSNSTYGTSAVPGSFVNTVSISDGGTPLAFGTFDYSTDAQNSNVTAGKYTYAVGATTGGAGGTYNYADGGSANTGTGVIWENFWDPAQPNPWIVSTNRP